MTDVWNAHREILAAMSPEQHAAHVAREEAVRAAFNKRERLSRTEDRRHTKRLLAIKAEYDAAEAAAQQAYYAAETAAFA